MIQLLFRLIGVSEDLSLFCLHCFNLEHPNDLAVVTEVNEDANDDEDLIEDEANSTEDEFQRRFDKMTFVGATRKLEQLPHWVKVTEVFKTGSDAPFLKRAGVSGFDDLRCEKYSQRLARLRGIRKYVYRMDVLERWLSYDEVTEIFVRVNSLGAKLRSSDLALAQTLPSGATRSRPSRRSRRSARSSTSTSISACS